MFDWLGDILSGLGDAVSGIFESQGVQIASAIWDGLVEWFYNAVYGTISDLFVNMNQMGAEIFDLGWVAAIVELFRLLGWSLYVVGIAVAVFDLAIETNTGRSSLQNTALNILKGFFAASLVCVVPISLYRFCVSLQGDMARALTSIFASYQGGNLGEVALYALTTVFEPTASSQNGLQTLFFLLAFAYCTIKVFFANIKRGGILLIQVAVGELYMFSVPRGYIDGFTGWCRQIIALCLTAFLQTTLLFLGMLTCHESMLLGIGIMLSANEVPRIAQHFGLDSSVRVNMSSVIHTTSMAMSMTRAITRGG